MTLNIWNYQPPWEQRRTEIARVISEHQADVVALQETRHDFRFDGGKGQGDQLAAITGYAATSAVAQTYVPFPRVAEGLTLLTRQSPDGWQTCGLTLHPHLRADENHRICLEVSLHRQRSPVHVVDTHFSLESAARLSNAQETVAFVNRVAGSEPVVLMGDLNAEPSSPEIRYLIEEGGFVDVWDVARPADRGFTYASFNPVRRIDFILVRNVPLDRVEARLVGTLRTDGVFPSDHLGIVADLPSL